MDEIMRRYVDLKEKVVLRQHEFKNLCDFVEAKTPWLTYKGGK